jgi:hypothetical protein
MRRINIMKGRSFPKGSQIEALGGNIVAAKAFSRKQAVFNEKAMQYARQGVITTPGYLRLETTLAPSAAATSLNTISFNTLDTSGTKQPTERRLKLSDTFTVTDISFYIGTGVASVATGGVTGAPSAVEQAKELLHTFPNQQVVAIGANNDDLEAIYNGFMSLRVDTTTFLDSIPMRQFYRVGDTQQGTIFSTGGTATNKSSWNSAMYGKTPLLPTIELNGQSNIEWAITLPTSIPYTQVADTFCNAVIVLEGFLNQGAASTQRNVQRNLRG